MLAFHLLSLILQRLGTVKRVIPMEDEGLPISRQRMVHVILRYFIENPDAKDTADGIQKWWIPKSGVELTRGEVRDALDFLGSKGWVIKRALPSSKIIYSVEGSRFEEIRSFVSGSENRDVDL
jgi:hypothetical protein